MTGRKDTIPIELPDSPADNFPFDLWPETIVLLRKAKGTFSQGQTLEFCISAITCLTQFWIDAVNAGNISAAEVLTEGYGGMADLLRLILIRNAGASSSGGLSDEACELWRKVWNSAEWSGLEKKVMEAQRGAQNSDRTAQGPEAKTQPLTEREGRISEVIQRGSEGLQYCRELDAARIAPPRTGVWKEEGPRTYVAAYQSGEPWRHRIQDEKAKIRRKAELANSQITR